MLDRRRCVLRRPAGSRATTQQSCRGSGEPDDDEERQDPADPSSHFSPPNWVVGRGDPQGDARRPWATLRQPGGDGVVTEIAREVARVRSAVATAPHPQTRQRRRRAADQPRALVPRLRRPPARAGARRDAAAARARLLPQGLGRDAGRVLHGAHRRPHRPGGSRREPAPRRTAGRRSRRSTTAREPRPRAVRLPGEAVERTSSVLRSPRKGSSSPASRTSSRTSAPSSTTVSSARSSRC